MGKVNYQFTLPVSILKEGDSFIAYTPALDLSTVGDTFKEVLTQLGWQKVDKQLVPPIVISNQTKHFSIPLNYA
ncbi:MAG: hypothetical protein UT01_C0026G0001 [Candidatus Daviesbacteria bacterium GW2011_GWA1_38_7]|nr:MAG: hypothetical protein UT01_C0026G0001 [Candidatus Daviesbacteria bacterium GW2011_GWA1_38_7]OGE22924.1 MAG: hypothetical protein A2688_03415 [Candidatus Daviesbacteria bacterium RIFCSPHIGHO2_01_FULL_38_8]